VCNYLLGYYWKKFLMKMEIAGTQPVVVYED